MASGLKEGAMAVDVLDLVSYLEWSQLKIGIATEGDRLNADSFYSLVCLLETESVVLLDTQSLLERKRACA